MSKLSVIRDALAALWRAEEALFHLRAAYYCPSDDYERIDDMTETVGDFGTTLRHLFLEREEQETIERITK